MMRRESTMRVLRRLTFGTIARAAKCLGVCRRTIYRAEVGHRVSADTQRLLEATFHLPWAQLRADFEETVDE